jgi:hypothetical protein
MINNNVIETEPLASSHDLALGYQDGQSRRQKLGDWRSRACHTLKEAAEILSTPASQLRILCHRGDINPITGLGRKWRITTEDIEKLLGTRLRNH